MRVVEQNELLTVLVAIGVLIFAAVNREGLRELPRRGLALVSFLLLVCGLTLTVLEGLFWPRILNLLEHTCYGSSCLSLAVWVWLVFGGWAPWYRT